MQSKWLMPGEFEKHRGCEMIWPVRPGSWPHGGIEAQKTFCNVAFAIAESEHVWMLCTPGSESEVSASIEEYARDYLEKSILVEDIMDKSFKQRLNLLVSNLCNNITVCGILTDDAWARDVGPTIVRNATDNSYAGVDWKFNAWGGEYDGLYASWDNDDKAAEEFLKVINIPRIDAHPFVLEGGSIHSDGEGTVIVTESCLLSKGRNPDLSKSQIEGILRKYIGAEKVIWLPYGIYNDETNEHVDNVCAFARPAEVILAWTDNKDDPQYEMSMADYQLLENETDAKGRKFVIYKLPIPDIPVCIKQEELEGYEFEEGEDLREEGERLAASYVNFYISNNGIILPQFANGNEESDERAVKILQEIFPERKIYPIYARPIIVGGGNIHCITQQITGDGSSVTKSVPLAQMP